MRRGPAWRQVARCGEALWRGSGHARICAGTRCGILGILRVCARSHLWKVGLARRQILHRRCGLVGRHAARRNGLTQLVERAVATSGLEHPSQASVRRALQLARAEHAEGLLDARRRHCGGGTRSGRRHGQRGERCAITPQDEHEQRPKHVEGGRGRPPKNAPSGSRRAAGGTHC